MEDNAQHMPKQCDNISFFTFSRKKNKFVFVFDIAIYFYTSDQCKFWVYNEFVKTKATIYFKWHNMTQTWGSIHVLWAWSFDVSSYTWNYFFITDFPVLISKFW